MEEEKKKKPHRAGRPGRCKGQMLNSEGAHLKLVRGDSKLWVTLVRWISHPRDTKKPLLEAYTPLWGERTVIIDMVSGAVISGVSAWYLAFDDKERLMWEAMNGRPMETPNKREVLPVTKKKRFRPLLHAHKKREDTDRIRERSSAHGGHYSKYGRKEVPGEPVWIPSKGWSRKKHS